MDIKNEMELIVKAEIRRQGKSSFGRGGLVPPDILRKTLAVFTGRKDRISCQCPLCTIDIMALSLSALPPCYCRSQNYGTSREKVQRRQVITQVGTAMRRVSLLPRHPAGEMVPHASGVKLVDFNVKEGSRLVRPLLVRNSSACTCSICQEDTLALGLNRAPARYGVLINARYRMPLHQFEFLRHELVKVLDDAAKRVAVNPRHESKEAL